MLSKKVARAKYGKEEPYKKIEFPKLTDYAMVIVAANFHLYPSLRGLNDEVKEKVTSFHHNAPRSILLFPLIDYR